ncbi:MAG: DUF7005 family protein [Thermoanaerobaculum sp.]
MDLEAKDAWRREFWRKLGADEDSAARLFALCTPLPWPASPIPPFSDEPHVAFYRALPVSGQGLYEKLAEAFPQLFFLPAAGLRQSPEWNAAVGRGETPAGPLPALTFPEGLALHLLPTPVGTLPALVCAAREDFERLVQLLAYRGEPLPVPPSMGATLVQGLPNRTRFKALEHRSATAPWLTFREAQKRSKALYQDRLVLAWDGPYSGVAAVPGLDERSWRHRSLTIRLAHEATHYLTVRVFARLGHTVLEELVADWVGLWQAFGDYPLELAQRFLGVEGPGTFRPGGRLANYRGTPPVSEAAFALLATATARATETLAKVKTPAPPPMRLLVSLLSTSLEELAEGCMGTLEAA